jgi:methylmalonyl-CoA mutase cobalamin-binding subunit
VVDLLSQKRWGDILVIGGGIIPPDDAKKLKE